MSFTVVWRAPRAFARQAPFACAMGRRLCDIWTMRFEQNWLTTMANTLSSGRMSRVELLGQAYAFFESSPPSSGAAIDAPDPCYLP
jgi:hypothetical protein